MVPYGGKAPKFDTNPISVAVPAGEMPPFLLDFATSTVAEGKIGIALERGDSIPRDWILDENGNPTTDPGALKRGGVMLPFGGHKGYAIAMLVDILSGVLTGAGSPSLAEKEEKRSSQGVFMAVINISSFTPIKTFYQRIDEMLKNVKQTPPAPGFKEVLIPGEPEFDAKKKRTEEGIFISEKAWQGIMEAGKELGLDVTRILKSG
jgi:LDH2 family malate/lactate/ureidoglycolate dehydrogenase